MERQVSARQGRGEGLGATASLAGSVLEFLLSLARFGPSLLLGLFRHLTLLESISALPFLAVP